jgi:hypothetical protein
MKLWHIVDWHGELLGRERAHGLGVLRFVESEAQFDLALGGYVAHGSASKSLLL